MSGGGRGFEARHGVAGARQGEWHRTLARLAAVLLLANAAKAAGAEAPRPPGSAEAGPEGFTLRSADGAFSLRLRPLLQLDGRFFVDDEAGLGIDSFVARRVRPALEGKLFKIVGFTLVPELGEASDQPLLDAFLELRPRPEFGLRAGRFRAPIGLEALQSVGSLFLLERSLATQLVPIRDLGAQLQGELFGGGLAYAVGLFNGAADGANLYGDFDDSKELDGRLFGHPFKELGLPALERLGLGLAGSYGAPRGTAEASGLPGYKSVGGLRFFSYRRGDGLEETAVAAGERWRLAPQASWFYGPLGLLAEYVLSSQRVALGQGAARLQNSGWQLALAFVLGADASYGRVAPRSPLSAGGPGALELSARAAGLAVDPAAFPRFADPERAARAARDLGVGLSWLLEEALAVRLSFDATSYDDGARNGDRPTEYLVLGRLQLAY